MRYIHSEGYDEAGNSPEIRKQNENDKGPVEQDRSIPEVAPEPLQPEIDTEIQETPIEVIEGALDEIRRKEREDEGRDIKKPTIH